MFAENTLTHSHARRPLKRYVIATPDIQEATLRDEDEFLILASDGLWDVISNQVRFVRAVSLIPC